MDRKTYNATQLVDTHQQHYFQRVHTVNILNKLQSIKEKEKISDQHYYDSSHMYPQVNLALMDSHED